MNLDNAFALLDRSSLNNILLEEAADACITFLEETKDGPEKQETPEIPAGESASMFASGEQAGVLADYFFEKRIQLAQQFCSRFVSVSQQITDDLVRTSRQAKRKNDQEVLNTMIPKSHAILGAFQKLALYMADVDKVCLDGLYLACDRQQKQLGGFGRHAMKSYNDGRFYSEVIAEKVDLTERKYSYLEMLLYPSGKKPKKKKK